MTTLYQFIVDQRGTATTRQCCDFMDVGVNALMADLNHLERIGSIKRDGSVWRAIRKPHTPPPTGAVVFGVRV
jgi:hypothetical protein